MDQRPGWKPRIFYSDGPDQGLPEEFPTPMHLRWKERGTHNRGMLYAPAIGAAGGGAAGGLRHTQNYTIQAHRQNHRSQCLVGAGGQQQGEPKSSTQKGSSMQTRANPELLRGKAYREYFTFQLGLR